jgi:hypothetical protein
VPKLLLHDVLAVPNVFYNLLAVALIAIRGITITFAADKAVLQAVNRTIAYAEKASKTMWSQ